MKFFIADDSRQNSPSRDKMGPLVSIGGFCCPVELIADLEKEIEQLCRRTGFPLNDEFKWSPGKELWMYDNLKYDAREDFFKNVVKLLEDHKCRTIVVISDTKCACATDAQSPERDVVNLFLERVQWNCIRSGKHGVVITDRPSGGRGEKDKFLLNCLETLQEGTDRLIPDRIALNILSSPSKFMRLLQAADLIVGCTLSVVAGARRFSPPIFEVIRPLLDSASPGNRISGVGLKIHPFLKYVNLYYWLLEEKVYWRQNSGTPLPIGTLPYSQDQFAYEFNPFI